MNPAYIVVLTIHVLSAAVLFGTGMGIAFFMVWAHRTGDTATMAAVARIVVTADFIFTATAVVIQPLSGVALAHFAGIPLSAPWLVASYALYGFVGLCWLPVVAMQMRMRALLEGAVRDEAPPPDAYHRLYHLWFALGWPAFAAVIAIYVLMLAKPTF